jgi:PhoH-like ATPase
MAPWMGALIDNLELLGKQEEDTDWEKDVTKNILMNKIKIRSLNFMRGRTFLNRYLIIDEAQNLTPKQIKTLITRAGPGTKIICIGNLSQIDTSYCC